VLILGLIVFGMAIGAVAQLILGQSRGRDMDWAQALVAGLAGSFVGGLLSSLIIDGDIDFHPSGIIGSLIGAIIITAIWSWWRSRQVA
jgi:uncharacterized membrane protein YeaQ/YmgE (transglycosylase-associated protein family)